MITKAAVSLKSGGRIGVADAPIDQTCINTIRTLAMDAVQQARSGHPGAPMALAPLAYTIWQNFLRFDPDDPVWPNRDRFVLSNGHASMLLYAILHLGGVKSVDAQGKRRDEPAVALEDIKRFRQLGSKCPGHPEYGLTSGVETTTGPLGQGCGNSVGMALAARWLAQHFNRPGYAVFDYDVYTVCGDGDMMEGVSSEAASLAGFQKLGNLCWFYDSNRITIEGHTDLTFGDDVATRFRAYGWHVQRVTDANDTAKLVQAIETFRKTDDAPTLIIVESHIGYGAPHKQDTSAAHGEPLGEDEVRLAKLSYGWPEDAKFLVPDGVREHFQSGFGRRGRRLHDDWRALFASYRKEHPDLAARIGHMQSGGNPQGWDASLPAFPADARGLATRDSSGKVLNAIAAHHPWLIGGAADLAPSTKTHLAFDGAGDLEADTPGGRNMHFGVREHVMGAIVNGLALSKLRPFGSTFLIFSDYMKPPIRLAALMDLPDIFIFTHDSIGVGEDGPTHQPVEQLVALRSIPGLVTLRPADANEVVESWRVVMGLRHQPACLVLTRQPLPTFDRTRYAPSAGVQRGAYVLADAPDGKPSAILIGTGSEVSLCVEVYEDLKRQGIPARVVSMPSWELFERQDRSYRDAVLPPDVTARVSVEMGSVIGWDRYVGAEGARIGMSTFGASAPLKDLLVKFGFTPAAILATAKDQIAK
ncbi:MAG: transketolase, partial [Rhizobiales bacterium]|nr:transketolase [Hyphomicrobiales bacterium]